MGTDSWVDTEAMEKVSVCVNGTLRQLHWEL
jgi:hypothetical protein